MQRDLLLLEEMIDAGEQAHSLVAGRTVAEIESEGLLEMSEIAILRRQNRDFAHLADRGVREAGQAAARAALPTIAALLDR